MLAALALGAALAAGSQALASSSWLQHQDGRSAPARSPLTHRQVCRLIVPVEAGRILRFPAGTRPDVIPWGASEGGGKQCALSYWYACPAGGRCRREAVIVAVFANHPGWACCDFGALREGGVWINRRDRVPTVPVRGLGAPAFAMVVHRKPQAVYVLHRGRVLVVRDHQGRWQYPRTALVDLARIALTRLKRS